MNRLLLALAGVPSGLAAGLAASPASAQAGFTTVTRYDWMHRVTGVIETDPDGGAGPLGNPALRNSYDQAGRLVRVEKGELSGLSNWQDAGVEPSGWTSFAVKERTDFAYDALDRKVREAAVDVATGAAASLTETSYDNVGRVECVAVRMNPAWFGGGPYDACTLLSAGSYGYDRVTRNAWDEAGQLLKVRKAYGTPLQQDYVTYEYTPDGKQSAVIDADGNRAEMTWDGHDRQQRWIFPSPTPPAPGQAGVANPNDFEAYEYDLNGNRTSLRKRDGSIITYTYDERNRPLVKAVPASATGAPGYTVYTGHDNRGLETYARFGSASGTGITNVYDNAGRLASTTTNMDGTARWIASSYDGDGNRVQLSAWTGYLLNADYDGVDRVTALRESTGNAVAQFAYDAAGRRQTLSFGNGAVTSTASYAYDGANRLTGISHDLAGTAYDQSLTFAYNPAHQIVSRGSSNDAYASTAAVNGTRSYQPNGLNQYAAVNGNAYTYDANGNLTFDGISSYVYDAENRLVSRSGGVWLSYDPLGRLWEVVGPTETVRFEYDGDRLLQEYNSGGGLMRAYVHGPGADEPLVWYEETGGALRRYLHADHQGSIIAVNDEAGNGLNTNAYDPWGVPNGANQGRFGYTGQAWIPQLGMYYYKARIYSPMLGRFLQTDPIGYKDQVNLYAYVRNDPVDGRDPTGLYVCKGSSTDCTAISGYVAAAKDSLGHLDPSSDAAKRLSAVLAYLGEAGVKNGVKLISSSLKGKTLATAGRGGRIRIDVAKITASSANFAAANPGISAAKIQGAIGGGVVAHESQHEMDMKGVGQPKSRSSEYALEMNAYRTQQATHEGLGVTTNLWSPAMSQTQLENAVAQGANASTVVWCERSGRC